MHYQMYVLDRESQLYEARGFATTNESLETLLKTSDAYNKRDLGDPELKLTVILKFESNGATVPSFFHQEIWPTQGEQIKKCCIAGCNKPSEKGKVVCSKHNKSFKKEMENYG
jgi:hypothetical protein